MKKGNCMKCGTNTYLEKHHVLPKNTFGETGDKIELCPNCHTEYHQELGYKNLKNKNMLFHLTFWYNWFYGGTIFAIIIAISIIGTNLFL